MAEEIIAPVPIREGVGRNKKGEVINEYACLTCGSIRQKTRHAATRNPLCKSCSAKKRGFSECRNGKTHGMSRTRIYRVWRSMRQRCYLKTCKFYPQYGGRGISVCDEWNDFPTFYAWAVAAGVKSGLHIDRINNNGNYEPSNCRFVTVAENNQNSRNAKIDAAKVKAIREMRINGISAGKVAEECGISKTTVNRVASRRDWSNID